MIIIIALMVLISLCLVIGQIFLKFAFIDTQYSINSQTLFTSATLQFLFSKFFITSIAFFITGVGLWMFVLSQDIELSVIYPLVSFSYIIMALLANFFLNEALTFQKIVGILIICIGITILMWGVRVPLQ